MNMMERTPETRPFGRRNNLGVGIGLIAIGTLLVLGNIFELGIFLVLLLGLVFIAWGITTRTAGLLIPGGILSGIGTGIALAQLLPITNNDLSGGIFLLSFALGWFSIVVLSRLFTREPQWWALIPGGIMAGIGMFNVLISGPFAALSDDAQGALFMLMFAAGWLIVAVGTTLFTRTLVWWPLIPGAIMGYIGAAVLLGGAWVQALELVSDWWPIGLVGLGAWLLVRRRVTSNDQRLTTNDQRPTFVVQRSSFSRNRNSPCCMQPFSSSILSARVAHLSAAFGH